MMEPNISASKDLFDKFYEQTRILIPIEVQNYSIKNTEDSIDLVRTIFKCVENKEPLHLIVQISNLFAKQLIEDYYQLNRVELKNLEDEVRALSPDSIDLSEGLLNGLLIEGVEFYDYHSNTFKVKFIDEAFRKLNSNIDEIKVVLCTWAHCGGWGGLILRGKNSWYHGGGMHGHYLEVDFQEKSYEYSSNFYERMEKRFVQG